MSADKTLTLSLRKACQNCARAKRRCIARLPSCLRCSKKRLKCNYTLEPLSENRNAKWASINTSLDELSECCFLRLALELDANKIHPALLASADWKTMSYILWVIRQTPECVRNDQLAPFIHPKLQFRGTNNYLARIEDIWKTPDNEHFRELLAVKHSEVHLYDAISAHHALMLYLIKFVFCPELSTQNSAESYFNLLDKWSESLYNTAADRMPAGLSAWQAWLLGETTRRTILMAAILPCAYSGWKYGVCRPKLCFEALPFDGRIGLWQAESPQAWISSAGVKTGSDVGTQLVSFHEFATSGIFLNPDDDTFLSLALVAHNGKRRHRPIAPLPNEGDNCLSGSHQVGR